MMKQRRLSISISIGTLTFMILNLFYFNSTDNNIKNRKQKLNSNNTIETAFKQKTLGAQQPTTKTAAKTTTATAAVEKYRPSQVESYVIKEAKHL